MSKIILEDFNEGNGYYKVDLAYLNKEQVEEIEALVSKWKPTDEDIKSCIGMCLTDANEQRFKDYGTNLRDCLAWLEKQGTSYTKRDVDEAFVEGMACAKNELEKQGEQPKEATYTHEVEIGNGNIKALVTEKVQLPTFKVGDWITDGQLTCKVLGITGKSYELHLHNDDYCHFETDVQSVDKHYHLWTIKDAHDGDVLTSISFHSNCTFIFKSLDNWKFDEPNGDRAVATGYCCLTASADKMEFGIQGPDCVEVNTIKPATKIQRDLLFQKMHEAGYTFDFKKKELKKIEQKSVGEEIVEALRTEYEKGRADAIAEMQKEWSEDDEKRLQSCINILKAKSLMGKVDTANTMWLKSLKQRMGWKPSDEQMELLKDASARYEGLESLYNDLKKLKSQSYESKII